MANHTIAGHCLGGRDRRSGNRSRLGGVVALLLLLAGVAKADEAWFEAVREALTVSSGDARMRARLSGTLELEGYEFSQPAPGLIGSSGSALFSPRLTTFLDAQAGDRVYAFAQARADRGFDPGRRPMRGRLDEYAIRFTPWSDGRLNVQVGKFATVVGSWVVRHGAWENPFVTAPLAYDHLTGIWDAEAVDTVATLLMWAHVRPSPPPGTPATDKPLRLPILWGPSYVTGAAVSGELGRITYAFEAKDASVSSRPRLWDAAAFQWRHPTLAARIGYRPNAMWNVGVSAARGTYLEKAAGPTLAPGRGRGDYREELLAQDVSFAWHHWQVWAEAFEARFTIPGVGDAETFSYYVEAKYKFTAQFAGAVRWNEQRFSHMDDGAGGRVRWGANVRRLEVGPIYRLSANLQLKVQYSWQWEDSGPGERGHVFATQLTVRF